MLLGRQEKLPGDEKLRWVDNHASSRHDCSVPTTCSTRVAPNSASAGPS